MPIPSFFAHIAGLLSSPGPRHPSMHRFKPSNASQKCQDRCQKATGKTGEQSHVLPPSHTDTQLLSVGSREQLLSYARPLLTHPWRWR